MFILLLLLLILVKRLTKFKGSEFINIAVLLSFTTLFYLLLSFLLQIELLEYGKLGTTGSDSFTYFSKAINLLKHPEMFFEEFKVFAGGYTIFCYLILKTSFFISPVLLVYANILLFLNIIIQLYILMNISGVSNRVKYLSLFLIILNGHIIWTVITVLKDTLLLFLVIEIFLIINSSQKVKLYKWLLIVAIITYLQFVRPYIGLILIPIILYSLFIKEGILILERIKRYRKKIIFISITVFLILFILFIINHEIVVAYFNSFLQQGEAAARNSLKSYGSEAEYLFDLPLFVKVILGYGRIILLPFPLKVLIAPNDFILYRILAFIGSSIWWLIIWYAFISVAFYRRKVNRDMSIFKPLLVYTFFILTTYVFLYSGTASSRLRMPLYIFATIFAVNSFFNLKPNNTILLLTFSVIFFILVNLIPVL